MDRIITREAPDPRTLRKWALPIGIGMLLVFAFVFYSVLTYKARRNPVLHKYGLECLTPTGAMNDYVGFEARGAKPPGGWYAYEIRDAKAPADAVPLLALPKLGETRWTPSPKEIATLPNEIVWRIRAFDAEGVEVDRAEARAWRKP